MKVLMIGDIVGKIGRRAVFELLGQLKEELEVEATIANAENAAGGFGLTPKIARQLFSYGLDVLTTGNHVWSKKEIFEIIEDERILRPLNYPGGVPGHGSTFLQVGENLLGVINACGRVFIRELDCPFVCAKKEAEQMQEKTPLIVVDMHGEATSEKVALGWYLDGLVSAVVGTHTHIQTADEKILPQGTAYISDIGMTGPTDSVIGLKKEIAIKRFLTQLPERLDVATGPGQLEGVLLDLDPENGRAKSITRIHRS